MAWNGEGDYHDVIPGNAGAFAPGGGGPLHAAVRRPDVEEAHPAPGCADPDVWTKMQDAAVRRLHRSRNHASISAEMTKRTSGTGGMRQLRVRLLAAAPAWT